jgi:hypothetical protein
MRMRIVMEEHYTGFQHSTTFVLNGPTQFFPHAIHFLCYCGPLLHEFHHLHSFPVPENSGHLHSDVCLNVFCLFGECVCIHCFDCSLVSIVIKETQVSLPVCSLYDVTEKFITILVVLLSKSQTQRHSLHFMYTHLAQNL